MYACMRECVVQMACSYMMAILYIYSQCALINLKYHHAIFALHRATNAVYSALLTALRTYIEMPRAHLTTLARSYQPA